MDASWQTYYVLTEAMSFQWLGRFQDWEEAAEFADQRDEQLERNTLWIMDRKTAIVLLDEMKKELGL